MFPSYSGSLTVLGCYAALLGMCIIALMILVWPRRKDDPIITSIVMFMLFCILSFLGYVVYLIWAAQHYAGMLPG